MANFCRREIQEDGEPVKTCDKAIRRVNALDWCQDCRARLPFWPADDAKPKGEPSRCPGCGEESWGKCADSTCPTNEEPKHHDAFNRKTGEGQEHLGPRGIETFVKADEFSEAS